MVTVEQEVKQWLKPGGQAFNGISDPRIIDAILYAMEGKEVVFFVNSTEILPDRKIELFLDLCKDKVHKIGHRPFYASFKSGGRISCRLQREDGHSVRGMNPDLIIYDEIIKTKRFF